MSVIIPGAGSGGVQPTRGVGVGQGAGATNKTENGGATPRADGLEAGHEPMKLADGRSMSGVRSTEASAPASTEQPVTFPENLLGSLSGPGGNCEALRSHIAGEGHVFEPLTFGAGRVTVGDQVV